MSQEIQTTQQNQQLSTLRTLLEKASSKLAEVAPKHLKIERLTRLLLSACSRNPKILTCSPESVLQFAMQCSQTGLEPIGAGGAWPIPYENRKTGKCELQFIPDYRGLVNCAKRAECVKDAFAEVVREKDEFDYALGMNPFLTHKPARGDRGSLECAYCIIVFPDDTKRFVVMDGQEIKAIQSRSRAANSGPWQTDTSEMWKKTVVRRAMKPFAGMSQELNAAIQADDKASAVVEAEPIAMPKAVVTSEPDEIPGAESPNSSSATSAESTSSSAPSSSPEGSSSAPDAESEQEAVEVMTAAIVGIHARIGKGPWKLTTDPESTPKLQTFDDKLIEIAKKCKLDEPVRISFRTETKGQFTNRVIVMIEP